MTARPPRGQALAAAMFLSRSPAHRAANAGAFGVPVFSMPRDPRRSVPLHSPNRPASARGGRSGKERAGKRLVGGVRSRIARGKGFARRRRIAGERFRSFAPQPTFHRRMPFHHLDRGDLPGERHGKSRKVLESPGRRDWECPDSNRDRPRIAGKLRGDWPEAGEACQRLLLLGGGVPLLMFDSLDGADGGNDVASFSLFAAGDGNGLRQG